MDTKARTWSDVSDDELRDYQGRSGYQNGLLAEDLQGMGASVAKAQAALNEAERQRRVLAMIAVRSGRAKTTVANDLGVSRPTLDAWLRITEQDEDEMGSVEHHERFLKREIARGRTKNFDEY